MAVGLDTVEKPPCCGLCAAAPAQSTTNPGCVRITCSVMHFDFVLHVHLWLQTAVSVEHWAPSAQRKCCVCVQYTAVPAEAGRVRFEVSTVAFVMPWVGSEGLRRGHHECRSRSIQYDVCMFSNFDVPPIFVTWCSRRRFASLTGFLQGASERGKDSTDLPIRHDSGPHDSGVCWSGLTALSRPGAFLQPNRWHGQFVCRPALRGTVEVNPTPSAQRSEMAASNRHRCPC